MTWIPRVLPFLLVKYKGLPASVTHFLKFLPITILFALTLQSLMEEKPGQLPSFLPIETLASIPTLLVAIRTKNLLYAVLTGIAATALLRCLV